MIRKGVMIYNGLEEFIEGEGKLCSIEPELITPVVSLFMIYDSWL